MSTDHINRLHFLHGIQLCIIPDYFLQISPINARPAYRDSPENFRLLVRGNHNTLQRGVQLPLSISWHDLPQSSAVTHLPQDLYRGKAVPQCSFDQRDRFPKWKSERWQFSTTRPATRSKSLRKLSITHTCLPEEWKTI